MLSALRVQLRSLNRRWKLRADTSHRRRRRQYDWRMPANRCSASGANCRAFSGIPLWPAASDAALFIQQIIKVDAGEWIFLAIVG